MEETVRSPSYILGSFVINELTMDTRVYFWALNSVPLISVSVLLTSHCFNYCIFVICFDIRMCDISSSILSQEYFGYLGSFVIPYEFYCFFSFCKNVIGILLGMH